MIICHSRRFVFVHVHKTGGTSIKTALDPLLQWNDLILGGTPIGEYLNEVYRQRFKLSKHASVAEIDKVCGTALCDEYYVFATVRHPVDRLCSIYNFIGGIVARSLAREGIAADSLAGPPGPRRAACGAAPVARRPPASTGWRTGRAGRTGWPGIWESRSTCPMRTAAPRASSARPKFPPKTATRSPGSSARITSCSGINLLSND